MESPQQQLGRNLAGQRKMAGLSQEELAFRANLDRTLISLIERGKRNARLDTLVKLGKGLGVPPASLLKGIPGSPQIDLPSSPATGSLERTPPIRRGSSHTAGA